MASLYSVLAPLSLGPADCRVTLGARAEAGGSSTMHSVPRTACSWSHLVSWAGILLKNIGVIGSGDNKGCPNLAVECPFEQEN
jgi:hypothetical protein